VKRLVERKSLGDFVLTIGKPATAQLYEAPGIKHRYAYQEILVAMAAAWLLAQDRVELSPRRPDLSQSRFVGG
jgi:hypothetical protein